jgi:hypothetical protein
MSDQENHPIYSELNTFYSLQEIAKDELLMSNTIDRIPYDKNVYKGTEKLEYLDIFSSMINGK